VGKRGIGPLRSEGVKNPSDVAPHIRFRFGELVFEKENPGEFETLPNLNKRVYLMKIIVENG